MTPTRFNALCHWTPLLLLITFPAMAATTGGNAGALTASHEEYRTPVTELVVKKASIRQTTSVQGVIEAVNAPELKSKVSAEVVEISVDEGDHVDRGQILARLDDEGFLIDKQAAISDIQRLQALLANQRRQLKRAEKLYRQKLTPDSSVDDARAVVKQTEAQLNHARALLEKAEYRLSHTRIIAPIAGRVQQRSVSVGDYVNPMSPSSKPLFKIADTTHLRARLYVPENLAHLVKKGMKVLLKADGETIEAKIDRLRPMIEAGNRSRHALASFINRPGWLPGESISAEVVLQSHPNAIVVPETVLVRRPAGLVVYRLADGRAEAVKVSTGIRQDGRVEILSGVQDGDHLAVDGAPYLSDGVAVEVQSRHTPQGTNR